MLTPTSPIVSNRVLKIAFVLDKKPMFTVFSKRDGQDFTHQVKALKIIWTVFPQLCAPYTRLTTSSY
jgi:ubiquitin-like domain-containing CTD phosphatase 1